MSPLVSVVVPVYNIKEYLPRCVDSVLNQRYQNLEVILVNDGSTDSCGDVCDRYGQVDERVKVIHQENGGLSDARNAGTDIATGEFITYLDGDDWLHREFINTLYGLLTDTDADIAICSNRKTKHFVQDDSLGEVDCCVYSGDAITQLLWTNVDQEADLHREMIVAWGKLYRKSLVGAIRYPKGRVHEDNFVTHQLLLLASRVVYTPEPLIYYFRRPGSITAGGFNARRRIDTIASYADRADFFHRKGFPELADYCRKVQFFKSFDIDELIAQSANSEWLAELKQSRAELKYCLRKGKHPLRVRAFFELYYLAPRLSVKLFRFLAPAPDKS